MLQRRRNILKFVFYSAVLILTMLCNKFVGSQNVNIGFIHSQIAATSINGIITCFQIFITVCFVIEYRQKGFLASGFLLLINVAIIIVIMVQRNVLTPLPGVVMPLTGFFIIYLLNKYLAEIDSAEAVMHKFAYTNDLTGLPNDHALDEHLEALIVRQQEPNGRFAVVNIEIDNFERINDGIGNASANNAVREIVKRWNGIVHPTDFLAKRDGVKFVLLVEQFFSEKELIQHIEEFAMALKEKIKIDGYDVYFSGGFGIAFFPEIKNSKDLLQCSDIAMRYAKQSGSNKIRIFESSMLRDVEQDIAIDNLVRHSLETDAFHLVFQPQFTSAQKKLRGFETLIRMNDLNGAPVSPAVFIPIAEKNGHIIEIDRWVLKQAMRKFAPLLTRENSDILISVNISALHMLEDGFTEEVRQALAETGFPPQNLELEITESLLMTSIAEATKTLKTLKEMGIKIALDDFGTGYTSLNYLRKLPVNLLKIDKSFVDEITAAPEGKEYIAAIISLGHILHLSVISEGVEETSQLDILTGLNCDYIQGYLWGKPMDFDSAIQLLA